MLIPEADLEKLLSQMQILDEKKVKIVREYMNNAHVDFQEALVETNVITDEKLGIAIANTLKIPFVSLSKISIPKEVFHIVPEKIARKHKIIAFARDANGIKVAMADPHNKSLVDLIAQKTQTSIIPHLATERDINNTYYIFKKDLQKAFDELTGTVNGKGLKLSKELPVSQMVDIVLQTAYYDKVSDIHIEPQEDGSLVRYRIDGILHDVLTFPKFLHERIMTRLKVLSRLRTDEHLKPQDGKMRIEVDGGNLDLRLSIIPIVEGEKAVLRLLSANNQQITLTDLGMSEADLEKISRAYAKSYGMILSTGPTGSGKSTSIYAILKILNTRSKNITTIEDPVEYRLKGINQIQTNPKADLTFASGLRSILRQDPNVVFVGEIRDSETAGIAVNAALTGHLVLSTLHTNDAATSLPRLMDMKIEPFLVASTVNVIIAQRLLRKICEMCKTSVDLSLAELSKNLPTDRIKKFFGTKKELRIYHGAGCKICHQTGYLGRVGIFEILEVTQNIRKLIVQKADSDIILENARKEGMSTMLDDGLSKVVQGITTIEEVLRVTKVESL